MTSTLCISNAHKQCWNYKKKPDLTSILLFFCFSGPANIRMVSPNSSPPLALPMQVPQGHMVQQLLDPNGTLQHVIFTPDPMLSQHQQQQPPPPQQSHHGVPITPYVSNFFRNTYRIVASRSTSQLVTCLGLFRLLMKGIFGPYVL